MVVVDAVDVAVKLVCVKVREVEVAEVNVAGSEVVDVRVVEVVVMSQSIARKVRLISSQFLTSTR